MKKVFLLSLFSLFILAANAQTVTVQGVYGNYASSSSALQVGGQDFGKSIHAFGFDATGYIIKGWGVNVGYTYGSSDLDSPIGSTIDSKMKVNQYNIGLAKKFKLPFMSIAPVVGANFYNAKLEGPVLGMEDGEMDENRVGLDLGVQGRVLFMSFGLKYDFTANFFKAGIGFAI
ncbi:hypothetical protein [Aureibacter tunicatorum]|uniref:Outer membrane protein beta-barrel domain-containing protein n=1 Tax=Aureibacter tunicatorum TaxID=866807 RepID=A0AAE3XSF8_9BACT|nr:hypothetical protein [Aureibacter tunicatorum]MDR6241685.1 hypothetical protein [Aureibacter tunicatorum]BDD07329.1 hypothetical protein AUTU_48120 [Aureibacter tunicatorum]